jgi:hypothetical protein
VAELPAGRAVAHAVAAVAALGDDDAVLRKATATAKAEIAIVKGLYAEHTGTWTGATEHVSVARELGWQREDLVQLTADGLLGDSPRASEWSIPVAPMSVQTVHPPDAS